MQKRPIYLVGFMGAGKSHIGQLLAKELGYQFVDLDQQIVLKADGMSIPAIFSKFGEAHFRKLEQEALYQCSSNSNTVIATGGGCPCYVNNMDFMKNTGYTVFLNPNIELLAERLSLEQAQRPLLANLNELELIQKIKDLLEQRKPYYQRADLIIRETEASKIIEQIVIYSNLSQ